jgi:UDP-glucose 4-epimerase
LLDVIENLENILDKQLIRTHQQDRVGDVRHSQADNSLLASLFPETVPVSLDEGLRQTTTWLRSYLAIA